MHGFGGGTHPCMSPTTVTGALTCTTLDSLISTSLVFSHISLNRASCSSCFRRSCSMHASRSKGAIRSIWTAPSEYNHEFTKHTHDQRFAAFQRTVCSCLRSQVMSGQITDIAGKICVFHGMVPKFVIVRHMTIYGEIPYIWGCASCQ